MFKFITQTSLVLTACLSAQIALAIPVLKPTILVESNLVTVGDMFDNAGVHAETALFRSPAPGTVGAVPLESIRLAAERAGLDDYQTAGLSQVRVERSGLGIDLDYINNLVNQELTSRNLLLDGETASIQTNTDLSKLFADPNSQNPVMVLDFQVDSGTRNFVARLALSGHNQPISINGRINILVNAPFLNKTLQKGDILEMSDIEYRPTSEQLSRAQGHVKIEDLIGKSLTRSMRGGAPIRVSDIASPDVINRNDVVTLYFKQGPMTLTVKAKALQSAAINQPISVLNLMSNKPIQGIVTGAGSVTISNGPAKVATGY